MADDKLSILVFPEPEKIKRGKGRPLPPAPLHVPLPDKQEGRLQPKLDQLEATLQSSTAGLEPERVLVIEIAGTVSEFKRAVEGAGLEWFGESDIKKDADEHFYQKPKIGKRFFKDKIEGIAKEESERIYKALKESGWIDENDYPVDQRPFPEELSDQKENILNAIEKAKRRKKVKGCLFLLFTNKEKMKKLQSMWKKWKNQKPLEYGQTNWKEVFNQTRDIRFWGLKEILGEFKMIERWKKLLEPDATDPLDVKFQIELFYRRSSADREKNEKDVKELLHENGGDVVGQFIDMDDIAFHATKAKLPANKIKELVDRVQNGGEINTDIKIFKFSGLMYVRPTGQSIETTSDDGMVIEEELDIPKSKPTEQPVAAILDGAPNIKHPALAGRIELDDPDNLGEEYQAGERKHGTAMASLVALGDLNNPGSLNSKICHIPVMQPDPTRDRDEGFLDEVFFEDRIHRAVKRMLGGDGDLPAQAPNIKIINISLGDPDRPFINSVSPWARLLDWLSWRYKVLFCVSAGNYKEDVNVDLSHGDSNEEKVQKTLNTIKDSLMERRLLSPAESINSLTVGALHTDQTDTYELGHRVDLLPNSNLPSPISRFGHGFQDSVKPEIFFPGGRQFYDAEIKIGDGNYRISFPRVRPGQKVAWDGELKTVFTKGTSNATALATHNGVRIYEMLKNLRADDKNIPEEYMSVLIKTLLVHGAKQHQDAQKIISGLVNSRRKKEEISHYLGYGSVDVERVLACAEQRGTVIGYDKIKQDEVHIYKFPLPYGLSESKEWRRITVTLAWFSPINLLHRKMRKAKLTFELEKEKIKSMLYAERSDSDHYQASRGTVQHEVLEGKREISVYQAGENMNINIVCQKDATDALDDSIAYGLAATLEVGDKVDIPIYEQIRKGIQIMTKVPANA